MGLCEAARFPIIRMNDTAAQVVRFAQWLSRPDPNPNDDPPHPRRD